MKLNLSQLTELCAIAKNAAIEAGGFVQRSIDTNYQRLGDKINNSKASQIVTEIDLQSQNLILRHLLPTLDEFDLGLLAEEKSDDQSRFNKDYFWCIDPLDGTLPFSEGKTGYAISIALVSMSGTSVIGVVVAPDIKDTYTAIEGQGVYKNDQPFETVFHPEQPPLKVFSDYSLRNDYNYDVTLTKLNEISKHIKKNTQGFEISFGYGAVMNAISVMNNSCACYFKYPKSSLGGGSIWDFAATNLFFNELHLVSSEFAGHSMNLNSQESLYFNHCGVLYASSKELAAKIIKMNSVE